MRTILGLEECLQIAVLTQEDKQTQSEIYMWAILEGLSRTTWGKNWHEDIAEQPLCCIKGCTIFIHHSYFLFGATGEHAAGFPMCARCVARILYAERVWTLPPVRHRGWVQTQARPLHVKEN